MELLLDLWDRIRGDDRHYTGERCLVCERPLRAAHHHGIVVLPPPDGPRPTSPHPPSRPSPTKVTS